MRISYRKLETLHQLEEVSQLDALIWEANPIPTHQTLTAVKNGGLCIGAFHNEKMIGFVYGFAGYVEKEVYLCSHMMGIHPAYQNQGIGYRLKMKQAEEAKILGYHTIRWTYDPLEMRNGFLNISKLGAICSEYIENCYGDMNDRFNQGLPSDRFHVEWFIDSPYQHQRYYLFAGQTIQKQALLAEWEVVADLPRITRKKTIDEQLPSEAYFIPIPSRFQEIKKQDISLAKEWRSQTREIFQHSFQLGWTVANVIQPSDEPVSFYALAKRDSLSLNDADTRRT
ncbi:GNAT family N-acetyltransferase [Brevibacillus invocatus]|uniref:GNAT family N-acetyltransferase n=1 Tax=Brevibacillus invocatus TaxID=173959 RepID=UPI00203A4536|nr:GNAT family N-acetyltransferase [Brevibacillus invocatus]MCM3080635.1 GNAT family N-acetyltransferase [Brevibacillus invocatus]MCM3432520.1 GNAT family N-acetyltransferase [Brevibacillus invocatus]